MSRCVACGEALSAGTIFCPCHPDGHENGWAATNRVMCDLVHRGVAPPRLRPSEREGDPERRPAEAA
jgi:hypothetical protein